MSIGIAANLGPGTIGITAYPVEEREDGLYVGVPEVAHRHTLMDQMVDVMIEWGADQVGWAGSATKVLSWKRVTRERKCEFISGTANEQVGELVSYLKKSGLIG